MLSRTISVTSRRCNRRLAKKTVGQTARPFFLVLSTESVLNPREGSRLSSASETATSSRALKPLAVVLGNCKRAFVTAALLTFVTEMLSITPILYMLNLFDKVLSSRSEITLVSLTIIVIAAYAFWSALEWIRARLMVRISMRIDWDMASECFDIAFRRYVGRKNVNMHQMLGDLVNLRQFLTGTPMLALMSAPYAIVFIVIGGLFHPYLAIFSLVATVLLVVVTYLTQKVSSPVLAAANEASSEATRLAADSVRHAETALALGMHRNLRRRWFGKHQAFMQLQAHASESAGLLGGLSSLLSRAFPSLQMGLAIYLAIEGLITAGMVIAASFLISKAIAPMQKLLVSWKEIVTARIAYDRLNELLEQDDQHESRLSLPAPKGLLKVEKAELMPLGAAKPVLTNISFTVEPGDIVAVVGPSAAGKTSLLKMLVGIWRPNKGNVRLDGAEIADWIRDDLGEHIGYVSQDTQFFDGTVAENIARLGPIDPINVVAAARLVGIHELILTFPKGYETRLGETGHVLTGGQRQRLALARAVYGNPVFLVLDEPNASLDEASEGELAKAIGKLKAQGRTVIFSTHRMGLVGTANKMLLLAEGRLVAFGPTTDLINAAAARVASRTISAA